MRTMMKCPRCPEATLVAADRQDIEIDLCPSCRGVWLDRGELDKVIERSLGLATVQQGDGWRRVDDDDDRRPRPGYDRDDDDWKYRRKKSHWLKELFD